MIGVQETINWLSDTFMKAPIIGSAIRNPILCALLIVVTVMVIYALTVDPEDGRTTLRAGFYSFIFVTILMFLNNKHVMGMNAVNELDGIEYDDLPQEQIIPVKIDTQFN